jgi:hypothetical protein
MAVVTAKHRPHVYSSRSQCMGKRLCSGHTTAVLEETDQKLIEAAGRRSSQDGYRPTGTRLILVLQWTED